LCDIIRVGAISEFGVKYRIIGEKLEL